MEPLIKHFREITRAAFARHGFVQGEVVSNWAAIVGDEIATVCWPERISWPRATGDRTRRTGGTLVVRAAPGRALEVGYAVPRLIARINAFFGHAAIARIKVLQATGGPVPAPHKKTPAATPVSPCNPHLEAMGEGPLKDALLRLGRNLAAARQSSPQGK